MSNENPSVFLEYLQKPLLESELQVALRVEEPTAWYARLCDAY